MIKRILFSSQSGVALLMVLFITSIISIVGYGLFSLIINTSEDQKRYVSEQSSLITILSLESFAINYLNDEANKKKLLVTSSDNSSPINFPLDRGSLDARIKDMSFCFNLNLLVTNDYLSQSKTIDQDALNIFENLLKSFNIAEITISEISSSLIDWVDLDNFPDKFDGAEDDYYQRLEKNVLTPSSDLTNVAELRKIRGVTEEIFNLIKPYICALPKTISTININSMNVGKPNLLIALSNNELSTFEAEMIIKEIPLGGYQKIDQFLNQEIVNQKINSSYSRKILSTESDVFLLKTKITYDEFSFIMRSEIIDDGINLSVVSRKKGEEL